MPKFDIFNSTLDICILQEPATCKYIIGSYDGLRICGNKENCQYVEKCKLTPKSDTSGCPSSSTT